MMAQYIVTIKYYDFVFGNLTDATCFLNMAVTYQCDLNSNDMYLRIRMGDEDED